MVFSEAASEEALEQRNTLESFILLDSDIEATEAVFPYERSIRIMTTSQRTEKVSPLDKFSVLAGDIDQLRNRIDQITMEQSIDDLLEVLEVEELSRRFGVSMDTMRKRLRAAGGKVFRMGKKFVIRKVAFLEVIENLEQDSSY